MTETILQMPCLECEPPCPWPVDPPKTIEVRVFSLFTFFCSECLLLNTLYLPTFTSKTVGAGFIFCRFDQPFTVPLCTIEGARLLTSFNVSTQQLFMSFALVNQFDINVFSWNKTIFPPDSLTNGPFDLVAAVGSIQCISLPQDTIIRAV